MVLASPTGVAGSTRSAASSHKVSSHTAVSAKQQRKKEGNHEPAEQDTPSAQAVGDTSTSQSSERESSRSRSPRSQGDVRKVRQHFKGTELGVRHAGNRRSRDRRCHPKSRDRSSGRSTESNSWGSHGRRVARWRPVPAALRRSLSGTSGRVVVRESARVSGSISLQR